VEPQAVRFVEALRALPQVVTADFAGSLRRCRSTVRDIDLVVASTEPSFVMAAFAALPELARVEAQGDTKRLMRSDASPPECDGYARETDAGSANSSAICATEDTVSRRAVLSGGRDFAFQQPPDMKRPVKPRVHGGCRSG
jgi:hypothetical protein